MEKKPQKNRKTYKCNKCDFSSRDKKDYRRHLTTRKHRDGNNGNKNGNTCSDFICDVCRKEYKFRSGLSRHQKKCYKNNDDDVEKKTEEIFPRKSTNNETIESLMKQCANINTKCDNMHDLIGQLAGQSHTIINNKMTINMYLNDQCADAMNLTDFVDKVKVSLEDLLYTQQHGYVKGISNIFVKNLSDLDPSERPIHCSDKKRMQFYVKDENKWEKDNKHVKIDRSIAEITHKQIKTIREWEDQHPNFLDDDKLTGIWHEMCNRTMGGIKDVDRNKNKVNIKKEVSSAVEVKDAMK